MDVLVMLLVSLLPGLCHAALTKNVALGASAVQSSTYSSYGMANGAVDGNRDADEMLCTRTSLQNYPWWRVDLKNVYQIRRIIITNGGLETSGAEIRVGNSLTNNGNNNQLVAVVWAVPPGGTRTYDFRPTEGRYVNIFLHGMNRALSLCEVEVYAEYDPTCVPGNLALGANAVQSSIKVGRIAQKAVDGSRDTRHESCTFTNFGTPSWWRVDLKKAYNIRKVTITVNIRTTYGYNDLEGALIRIGNSLVNNGNNNQLAAVLQAIPDGGTKSFEFAPVNGRYVNIVAKRPYLCLCEVEVFCQ
ncbi:uncharacterized protein [Chanodichthys erythropterus]|uniref:uncharacterized protein n=1 Tax=Chanodichthys erythropterus TaxID=933992 RepID=UPI00351E9327